MSRLVGVVPAAGRGTRAYPYTHGLPKGLLEIDGEPILARVLAIFRDQLRIEEVVIVVGEHGELVRGHFGDGERFGLRLRYVHNDAVEKGLSHSVLLAAPHVGERFVVMLSDECYFDSNHEELTALADADALAVCAVKMPSHPDQVRRNYAVTVEDGEVRRIVEKPQEPGGALLGLGTFLLRREIFARLEHALARPEEGPTDLVNVLARACASGSRVLPFHLRGRYVNVNDRDELHLANNLARTRRFADLRIGVAVLGRAGSGGLAATLEGFRASGRCADLVAVLRPDEPDPGGLGDARIVRAPGTGYGERMRAGLDALDGDVLFTVWGDDSYAAGDLPKFLEYLKEADVVVGTRTTRQLVHQGTHMRGVVWAANVGLAKLLDAVWWGFEPRFTDVGCTYRALWSSAYRLIRPRLVARGPEFGVEMVLETLRCRRRVIEIPIHYRLRQRGARERDQNVRAAWAILATIVRRRFASPGSIGAAPPPLVAAAGRAAENA